MIDTLTDDIETEGYVIIRDYPNGIRAGVAPLLTGTGRIVIGQLQNWSRGYDEAYCYDTVGEAVIALLKWNGVGEPDGWFRNPGTGRRRPNGDKTKEYIWA
jgi:hypothetical protein